LQHGPLEGEPWSPARAQQSTVYVEQDESSHTIVFRFSRVDPMLKRLLIAVPLALIGAAFFYWVSLPWPVLLRWRDPGTTSFMEQRIAEADAEGEELELRYEFVPLDRISRNLRRAAIVAEDGNFESHNGVDWGAVAEELEYQGDSDFSFFDGGDLKAAWAAIGHYVRNRDDIRGRSTITQQLAKNLYFSSDRSMFRKLDEFVVARRLERFLSKDRILELYLNIAEWGPGVFGAEAAARHYFDSSAADLSRTQAAALAATLPHPLTSNPSHRPARMAWRRDLILARMGGSGRVRTVPLAPEPTAPEPPDVSVDSLLRNATDTATRRDTLRVDTAQPPDTLRPPPDTLRRDTLPTF
jgi:monofunctional biosynthetic peptidoglycan transglycosylase